MRTYIIFTSTNDSILSIYNVKHKHVIPGKLHTYKIHITNISASVSANSDTTEHHKCKKEVGTGCMGRPWTWPSSWVRELSNYYFFETSIRIFSKNVNNCMNFVAHDRYELFSFGKGAKVCDICFDLRKKSFLSSSNRLHCIRKWISSSTWVVWHRQRIRLATGVWVWYVFRIPFDSVISKNITRKNEIKREII